MTGKVLLLLAVAALSVVVPAHLQAPESPHHYRKIRVRLTVYSPKQPGHNYVNHRGRCVRNEKGVAVPKGFLPDGTVVILPGGQRKVCDDRVPRKSARKFGGKVVDIRYYQSIKSPTRTRAVNKELMKKDKGWGYVWVEERRNPAQ